jgi:hypothetical protein
MDGGLSVFVSNWSPSNAVLSVPQFQDSIWMARFVFGCFEDLWAGGFV